MYSEALLHFAWKFKLIPQNKLFSVKGENIEILDVGKHNLDAGPDFLTSKIKIGDTLWVGNVEIHIKSSDWYRHNHQIDSAYSNIILHIVLEYDKDVFDCNGLPIPVLELRDLLPQDLEPKWNSLQAKPTEIACQHLGEIDIFILTNWLDRMFVERLEAKTELIFQLLKLLHNDWNEVFYVWLARSFGSKVNVIPFELLARSVPLNIVKKHLHSSFQLEALFFGQSSLINEFNQDDYIASLWKEYTFLKVKYNLSPLQNHIWKFLRMRPANFPTIKISQFINFLTQHIDLFEQLIDAKFLNNKLVFKDATVETYWKTHYQADVLSKSKNEIDFKIGNNTIIINAIVPFLFVYGQLRGNELLKEKAVMLLSSLKPESNSIIDNWKKLNVIPTSAYDSQALIYLKNNYCDKLKCLDCNIGHYFMKTKSNDKNLGIINKS
jgi:hypothetical protein